MKAYHIMMFLLLFNMVFWVITTGIGIYNVGVSTDPGFDISSQAEDPTSIDKTLGIIGIFTMFHSIGLSMVAIGVAIAGGAMIGYLTAGQGAQGVVYGLFGYFFWGAMSNTMLVFYNLSNAAGAVLYVIIIFAMIVSVIFVAGLFQMVTGGWKAHE